MTNFNKFIYEQGIIGLMLGTISAFAISNLMEDLKDELFVKLVKKISVIGIIGNARLIASLIEFMLTMGIIYALYRFLLYPIFSDEIKEDQKEEDSHTKWKKEVLKEIKNLDMGTVYF